MSKYNIGFATYNVGLAAALKLFSAAHKPDLTFRFARRARGVDGVRKVVQGHG